MIQHLFFINYFTFGIILFDYLQRFCIVSKFIKLHYVSVSTELSEGNIK